MSRRVLLLALVACDAPAPPAAAPPAPHWVYAPGRTSWPLAAVSGRIGRAQAPQLAPSLGITGAQRVPLRLPTLWDVPGDSARAVAYGYEGVRIAVELIDIDAGTVVWRDTSACTGPIVGVTAQTIVCSDGDGVRGLALDGKAAWRDDRGYIAMTDDRIVVAGAGEAVILDAASGDELSRVTLPAGISSATILASCGDAGRELYAATLEHELVRVADVKGKPAITWRTPLSPTTIDACRDTFVIAEGGGVTTSLARDTGAVLGSIADVRGSWPARGDATRIELATLGGVTSYTRDLRDPRALLDLPLGALLAQRGDRRLVRATPATAVLLDRTGVAAYLALTADGAVLGEQSLVVSAWTGSPAHGVRRLAIPSAYRKRLRITQPSRGVAVPSELRDLPASLPLDERAAFALPNTGGIAGLAIADARVIVAGASRDDDTPALLATADLATSAWTWQRSDGCGAGAFVGIAVGRDLIACAAQGKRPGSASVRATSPDGVPRWDWEGDAVDAITAAADLVLVASADRTYVLAATTGRPRMTLASPARGRVAATLVDTDAWGTLLVAEESGLLVARSARSDLLPLWTLAVDGVITALHPAADGVLVELEGGDAYRVLVDGTVIAIPAIGLTYAAASDVLVGSTTGAPIYDGPPPARPVAPVVRGRRPSRPPPRTDGDPPTLWSPIPAPPTTRSALQLALYELTGGLRLRAEYDAATSTLAPRGPAGSPLVLTSRTTALVIDARTGDPLKHLALPAGAQTFATVVAGSPLAGAVLGKPLRVIVF